jgi:hypothetical protein
MELAEVRRLVRKAIESAKKESAERRQRSDAAARAYALFLEQHAVPTFHTFATALAGEGIRFKVFTPAESVRLAAEGASDDFIELSLDTTQDPPRVLGRTSRARGRRAQSSERFVRDNAEVGQLTDDDVLQYLLAEIGPFVER